MSLKETKKLSANRYELEIVIGAEKFADAIKQAYENQKDKISVPGFRKGKVPYAMVMKMYGEEAFFEDALNILYPDAVEEAINESGLKVINDKMDFDMVSISKEDGVDFKIAVTTYPEIEIGEYKGLKAEKVIAKVEDSEIDAQIKGMADRNARMVSVEDRAAQMGDTVVIDFEGFKDGVAFDGGKAEGHTLELGSGAFIPGFEEQIVGKNIDDEFEITVTFPEEYGAEELTGKEAVFK
ncbi:MAG: trigger factor, partial [Clostridia bacterium]|nr:trigger factor [Clostridia bacterium]